MKLWWKLLHYSRIFLIERVCSFTPSLRLINRHLKHVWLIHFVIRVMNLLSRLSVMLLLLLLLLITIRMLSNGIRMVIVSIVVIKLQFRNSICYWLWFFFYHIFHFLLKPLCQWKQAWCSWYTNWNHLFIFPPCETMVIIIIIITYIILNLTKIKTLPL